MSGPRDMVAAQADDRFGQRLAVFVVLEPGAGVGPDCRKDLLAQLNTDGKPS